VIQNLQQPADVTGPLLDQRDHRTAVRTSALLQLAAHRRGRHESGR
jgi:hypothetical protein